MNAGSFQRLPPMSARAGKEIHMVPDGKNKYNVA
ncbi:hypothetical protein Rta_32270 [Ramlibacter tataouinensis TTB310]|uniref:Uncharacterized protein n=1 Tax=Ramlibacter tataouinensis (strain ATCC BAA-407 / DSM 14655 / LMG 21543 / TTB310) TaxID=365046 RepID=F5XY13_RAMTT|nr:hypothetical protein Rta_32270 [Ramlibacter tataouinensis TTB310]